MTTTTTTTTNPMIRPAHQPPRWGPPNSFNVTSNPARNVLVLDQARTRLFHYWVRNQLAWAGDADNTESLHSITS